MLGWYQDPKFLKIISKPNAATAEGRLWSRRCVPVAGITWLEALPQRTQPSSSEPGQPGSLCVLDSRRPTLVLLTWDWQSFYPRKWIRLEVHWLSEASAVQLGRDHFDEEIFLFPQKTWSETRYIFPVICLWKYDSRLISSEPHLWFVRAEFKMRLLPSCREVTVLLCEWARVGSPVLSGTAMVSGRKGASSSPWSLLVPEQPLEVGLLSLRIFFF